MIVPEWVGGLVAAIALGIFADYIRMKIVITKIGYQIDRLVSDRESEKDTIRRVHMDFESRIRILESHTSNKI